MSRDRYELESTKYMIFRRDSVLGTGQENIPGQGFAGQGGATSPCINVRSTSQHPSLDDLDPYLDSKTFKMGKNDKKGKGGGGGGDKEAGGKAKGAQSINVRHILVSRLVRRSGELGRLNSISVRNIRRRKRLWSS